MDITRITECTDRKRRAPEAGDGPVDYTGRHVRVEREPASRNPHPRGQGFQVLSRLARASGSVERDQRALVLAS